MVINFFKLLFESNIVLRTDSYKLTHWKQYRVGTTKIVSYLEARIGAKFPSVLFFGLQPFLKAIQGKVLSPEKIEAAAWFASQHFGSDKLFNKEGWLRLYEKHGEYLPIKIKAVKEGTEVGVGNVLMILENTDPEFPWLTNYLETLLMKVWYMTTVATNSFYCKKAIYESLKRTTNNMDHMKFALHDFGYRGVPNEETAGMGGMAALVNFYGTDNIQGVNYANKFYNSRIDELTLDNYKDIYKVYGYSIPASEHSTATPFGDGEGEYDYIKHMLQSYPDTPFSFVIDSFDALDMPNKLAKFKGEIMKRNSKSILRPDSGNPIEVNLKLLNMLWKHFGGTYVNGYKVLNNKIGIIQGDGINYETLCEILLALENEGWAPDNLVFGSGGGLLQKLDRDTQRFAIKFCKAICNGVEINVMKNPKTDSTKKSKSGDLKLIKNYSGVNCNPTYMTISTADNTPEQFEGYVDELNLVFENGEIVQLYEFEEVRERAETYFK